MATATLTLPNGVKLRTQTERRYIVRFRVEGGCVKLFGACPVLFLGVAGPQLIKHFVRFRWLVAGRFQYLDSLIG